MDTIIFNKLMAKRVCQTGTDMDGIGFSAEHGPYLISFYGESENHYKVIVDDFGFTSATGWTCLTPSQNQLKVMQKALHERSNEIVEELRQEHFADGDDDCDGNLYNYYGVNPAMFI